MDFSQVYFFYVFLLQFCIYTAHQNSHFSKNTLNEVPSTSRPFRYLFYDVNPPEGFNLRRDVYLRMAVLSVELQQSENWVLVLPPWPRLYHWRSSVIQDRLSWSHFFDLPSLQKFAPVIEFLDFMDMHPAVIDQVFILQHFEEMFKTGSFIDKLSVEPCSKPHHYIRQKDGRYNGQFWGMKDVSAKKVDCLSFHGQVSLLQPFLTNTSFSTILLDHAEVPLHNGYGDVTYWRARRSMRFSRRLRDIAQDFRKAFLNSSNYEDRTEIPDDWTLQKPHRTALGGPYLAVHLRRRDFLMARSKEVPSLTGAVMQIKQALEVIGLNTVFLATDAPQHEIDELEELLAAAEIRSVKFQPTSEQLKVIKDGGVAVVDQIICSHARKFIGTHDSTFSFRIQEEREILGFEPVTTFNRLCGDGQSSCEQPAQWLIQY